MKNVLPRATWAVGALAFALLLVGCKDSDPLFCDLNNPCKDATRPFCDVDGLYNPLKNTCVPQPMADAGVDGPVDGMMMAQCTTSANCSSDTTPICGMSGMCRTCQNEGECTARGMGKTHCDMGNGKCVECKEMAHCTGSKPVCDVGPGTCRACKADNECGNTLCELSTGACVPESQIVFVGGPVFPGGPACGNGLSGEDASNPVCTLAVGLTKTTSTRKYVRITAGTYAEAMAISGAAQEVKIVGIGNVTVGPTGTNTAALAVSGGANVQVRHVTLTSVGTTSDADGVICSGSASAINLFDVKVQGSSAQGVQSSECTVTIERSTVSANNGGGVHLSSANFKLANNFIVKNGGTLSDFGGAWIDGSSQSMMLFVNNTVAENATGAASLNAAGVQCTIAVPIANAVVWGNGTLSLAENMNATCNASYSDVQGIATTNNNINMDPLFVTPGSNYHLQSTSPCINKGTATGAPNVDFDGVSRPRGGMFDIGAHEAG